MSRRSNFNVARHAEVLLWLGGGLCVAVCAVTGVGALVAKRQAGAIGKALPAAQVAATAQAGDETAAASAVMGRLDIPELSLTVPVMSDFDPNSLRRGVGHIQGTAMPGGLGTMGLAGHRDTYFRPLRRIVPKMDVRVTDGTGTYHYQVDSTEIVMPEQVQVLDIGSRPELTLITCYPFDYVGAAPKRFIVHAHLMSASPDTP